MNSTKHFVYRVHISYAPGQGISFLSDPIEGDCGIATRAFPISLIEGNDREAMKKAIGDKTHGVEEYLKAVYG